MDTCALMLHTTYTSPHDRSQHVALLDRPRRPKARRVCRACWEGWRRYHCRKQYKAAQLAAAARGSDDAVEFILAVLADVERRAPAHP